MKRTLISLACRVHAWLFSYMTRAGLILCDVDPAMVQAALQRIAADIEGFKTGQKEKLGSAVQRLDGFQAELLDVQQNLARRGSDPGGGAYDDGDAQLRALLEGSADLKAVADRKSRRAVIDMPASYFKALITSTGIAMPDQRPGIVAPVQRRLTIRALLPSVPTDGGAIQYLQETDFENNAATVSESDLKPESNFTLELKTAAVATIAHFVVLSLQALGDVPQLQQHIENRLRYGLALAEETQLLKGSGAGNNLSGLMTVATAYSGGTGYTMIDVLRRAAGQLEDTDYQPSGYVLNSADWRQIQMLKDTQGRYVLGDPGGENPARLWNLPVVATPAMTAETFLVLDGAQAAMIFDREDSRIDISTEDDQNFRKNLATVRSEERLALAVLRTGALVKGEFAS